MKSKQKIRLFFISFVCGHKDTTIFVITKIVIYLCRKYLDYYCVRTQITMNKPMNTPERIRIKDIAKMADVVIRVKSGHIVSQTEQPAPASADEIDW